VRHVEAQRLFNHPIERVWARYTDHVAWSAWAGMGAVRVVREGAPEPCGLGSVRAFSGMPGLREEVTAFEPPHRQEYRVTRGAVPLADHRGEVLFAPEGDGTRVTWRVSFRSRIPGLGWPLERALTVLFRRMLAGLARDLDRAG
jgi:uncharacterized protein YndB with AHSA1/START domain